jgi:hypothetical protein
MMAQVFDAGLVAVIPLVILALIVFAIVALVTGRRDPDPAGSRPYTIYLVLIIFFAMFTALFAITAMASNIAKAAQGHSSQAPCPPGVFCGAAGSGALRVGPSAIASSGSGSGTVRSIASLPPSGTGYVPLIRGRVATYDPAKQQTAAAIEAALVALVAIAVLWWHVGRLRDLVRDPAFNVSAGRRTYQVYLHAVSFTAAAIFIFAAAAALYAIFRIAAPGYSAQLSPENVERDAGVVQLVAAGFLTLGAWLIFRYHWRRTQTLRGANPLPTAEEDSPLGRHHAPPTPPAPPVAPSPGAPPATRPETPPAGPETPPASEPS